MHDRQVYNAITAEQDHDDLVNEVLHVEELKQTAWWGRFPVSCPKGQKSEGSKVRKVNSPKMKE